MKSLIAIVGVGLLAVFSVTARPASAAEGVRPVVGKPLKAAQALIRERKYKRALSEVDKADSAGNKTAYENLLIERMRIAAAIGAGAPDTAAKALDAAVATHQMPHDDSLKLMRAIADLYYRQRNYNKTIYWADRFRKAGGSDPTLDTLVTQAYYLKGDYAAASRGLQSQVSAIERAGRTPSEQQLRLLASSELKGHDQAGYVRALQQLVTYYPRPNYWTDLIIRVQREPGFSDRLSLDVFRLMLATKTLTKAPDYVEMAELALQAGFPVEAQQVLKHGFESKVLGDGPQASRQHRLKTMVDGRVTQIQKSLESEAKQASSRKDGEAMLAAGYNQVLYGHAQQGLALMRRGIVADKLRFPEDARLHLGLAYLKAGDKTAALRTLKSVRGHDGAAELARLWMVVARTGASR